MATARRLPEWLSSRSILVALSLVGFLGMAYASAASAQSRMPTVTSVVFHGAPANPQIIVRGTNFGTPPAPDPAGGTSGFGKCGPIAGNTGEDFGTSLWISDRSQLWSAGNSPHVDCMGVKVSTYTNTRIVYRLGSFYKIHYKARNQFSHGIYQLRRGDRAILYVGGTSVPVRVVYDRRIHVTSVADGPPRPSPVSAAGPLRADGSSLVDPDGRVVVLHGLFAVWKQPPLFPAGTDSATDPSLPSFTDADADEVRSMGLDAARLAWYWEGLEPTQGQYSSTYLDGIAGAEQRFASRGVYVVLDAHQDQYDHLFGNEPGFPEWSAVTDGQPLAPDPTDPSYSGWKFPLGYFHTSTELAFGNLYANAAVNGEGIGTAFGRAWQVIARRFYGDPMVAGYDLINEPFPATSSPTDPYVSSCADAAGCADFDRGTLESFQTSIAEAIRAVDRVRTVFYEPTFFFNGGVPNGFTAPPAAVGPAGLSFHNQCPSRTAYSLTHDPSLIVQGHTTCPPVSATVFRNARRTARRLGGPGLMTEVASTSDADVQGLNCILEQADRFQSGWTYGLSWSNPDDELRRLASESAPDGSAPFKQMILARVFPRAIAGVPQHYSFDVRTGAFNMVYVPRRDHGAPTIISVPASIQYPQGYVVRVSGARVVSAPGASQLKLTNDRGAVTVRVAIRPAPGSTVARPQFPACPATPPANG